MKKIISILAVLSMLSVMLAGCVTVKTGNGNNGAQPISSAAASSVNKPASAAPAGNASNISESYNAYLKVKGDALNRLGKKMNSITELAFSMLELLPVTGSDSMLVPLTVASNPGGAEALGLKIDQNGNEYKITYTGNDGKSTIQTCKYDPAADSVQSTATDGTGKQTMFFEYVRVGNGYASQYYTDNSDGTFMLIKSFVNDTDIAAFSMQTVKTQPVSISGSNSLTVDFVKGGDSYFILQGDALTVFENGETKTY